MVNLSMDGQTYQGATKILVGGKTINITEATASGSFTGDGTRNVSINTGSTTTQHIVITRSDYASPQLGTANTLIAATFYAKEIPLSIYLENVNGNDTFAGGWNKWSDDVPATQGYTLISGVFTIKNLTNGAGGSGLFKENATYNWVAW